MLKEPQTNLNTQKSPEKWGKKMKSGVLAVTCNIVFSALCATTATAEPITFGWKEVPGHPAVQYELWCNPTDHYWQMFLKNGAGVAQHINSSLGGADVAPHGRASVAGGWLKTCDPSEIHIAFGDTSGAGGDSSDATTKVAEPEIDGLVLDGRSIQILKSQASTLREAGYAQDLLAWSPLADVLTESSAAHAAFTITNSDWAQLAKGMQNIRRFVLLNCATQSLLQANEVSDPKVRQFWKEMADFYEHEANP